MWLGSYVFDSLDRRPSSHVSYGLTRGMWLLGFMIIFLLPPTLEPKNIPTLLGTGLGHSVVAGVYSLVRYSRVASGAVMGEQGTSFEIASLLRTSRHLG